MLDLSNIKEIEVKYEYKKLGSTSYYSEVCGKDSRTLAPNKDTLRFTIRDENLSDDSGIYQIVLKTKESEIELKGDFFTNPETWYEATASLHEGLVVISSEDADEKISIACHIE